MEVDQPPKDKVNYATIDERKSEESDDLKNYQALLNLKAC